MEINLITRKSPLALVQSNIVAEKIKNKFPNVNPNIIPITSEGDKISAPLHLVGGKGLFVSNLEEALRKGSADFAIHSLKDVPAQLENKFEIVGCIKRGDPSDSILLKEKNNIKDLADGSIIATSGPRRSAQLLAFNNTFKIVPIRGNIETRIDIFKKNKLDGLIVATAALQRLKIKLNYIQKLDYSIMLPAANQGIIGIEMYKKNITNDLKEVSAAINHRRTKFIADVERAIVKHLDGDCNSAIAVICQHKQKNEYELLIRAMNQSGSKMIEEAMIIEEDNVSSQMQDITKKLDEKDAKKIIHEK